MTSAIEELKIRARLLCKALARGEPEAQRRARHIARRRRWPLPEAWTLGLCLNVVSAEAGFDQWAHARRVLEGASRPGEDMGRLWYDAACAALLNHWFAGYGEARASLQLHEGRYLLPYETQFIVAEAPFVAALGLDPASRCWAALGRDLVDGYGTAAWHALAADRLRQAPRDGREA